MNVDAGVTLQVLILTENHAGIQDYIQATGDFYGVALYARLYGKNDIAEYIFPALLDDEIESLYGTGVLGTPGGMIG